MNHANTSRKSGRKNFIMLNEEFICENCGKKNLPLKGGCRNHCRYCLYSKHVDKSIPGDRNSECRGLMEPVDVDSSGKKGYILIHRCTECGIKTRNKSARDDDFDAIITLSRTKKL